ncbi:MAG: NAD(P)/FAD-dependent oxidoreductase, partial [Lentisphaeria bacterium]
MRIRVNQLRVCLEYTFDDIIKAVAQKLECEVVKISNLELMSRSIDARSASSEPFYTFSIECDADIYQVPKKLRENDYKIVEVNEEEKDFFVQITDKNISPLIVGAGPAGLMAALKLAKAGFKPLLIDRGNSSEERKKEVDDFWEKEIFNPESNVLFGEGGAGLFSDGKLTARSKDNRRMDDFFNILVECGADRTIKYDTLPHIGSDKLLEICPKIRELIIANGGQVLFNSRLDNLIFGDDGALERAVINGKEMMVSDCIVAIGHSARDTYMMLEKQGVKLESKAFAIGVRVEFPQWQVD